MCQHLALNSDMEYKIHNFQRNHHQYFQITWPHSCWFKPKVLIARGRIPGASKDESIYWHISKNGDKTKLQKKIYKTRKKSTDFTRGWHKLWGAKSSLFDCLWVRGATKMRSVIQLFWASKPKRWWLSSITIPQSRAEVKIKIINTYWLI